MSYFLCISGYFPPLAAWLSMAVSWLGAGNNSLPKNNSFDLNGLNWTI